MTGISALKRDDIANYLPSTCPCTSPGAPNNNPFSWNACRSTNRQRASLWHDRVRVGSCSIGLWTFCSSSGKRTCPSSTRGHPRGGCGPFCLRMPHDSTGKRSPSRGLCKCGMPSPPGSQIPYTEGTVFLPCLPGHSPAGLCGKNRKTMFNDRDTPLV